MTPEGLGLMTFEMCISPDPAYVWVVTERAGGLWGSLLLHWLSRAGSW